MGFLLKIVEGPNKGAEIALVDGVAVSLGKSPDCDIVLADGTLPDEPVSLEATASGVTVGGEPLAPLHVKTLGATSFAVGPADAPWGELVWPAPETAEPKEGGKAEESREDAKEPSKKPEAEPSGSAEKPAGGGDAPAEGKDRKKRSGCLGCLAVLLLLLIAAAVLLWLFREDPRVETWRSRVSLLLQRGADDAQDGPAEPSEPPPSLESLAARHGLELTGTNGVARLSGNFKTRRERLVVTAEAYQLQPGVDLDLSDDESFRTAADDSLFTLTEGALKVLSATNRCLSVTGVSPSPQALSKTLKALNGDIPKLRALDVSAVAIDSSATSAEEVARQVAKRRAARREPSLPVCGILTTPYPCLVLRSGARILEGASFGDSVVLKIEADAVTITNATGRFVWKP